MESPVAIPQVKAKRTGVFRIIEDKHTLVAGFKARFRIIISTAAFKRSRISSIKRTAMQLLSEFIGRQKIRLVGVEVSRLRERDEKAN